MLRKLTLAVALVAGTIYPVRASATTSPTHIDHVFVYVLENTSYSDVVGNPQAPYLNSLTKQFVLATNYTATGHESLDNYIAMTSGQRPNPLTMADCPIYGTPLCIMNVKNIGDQLEAKHFTWKGYMDSMPGPCTHSKENSQEQFSSPYATRHNPFMYYSDIVDNVPRCDAHDVPLTDLWNDQAAGTVPNYSFITPNTCHDAHDSGSSCDAGGGIHEADVFASETIPKILADPSWTNGGLLVVTFDEGATGAEKPSITLNNVDFGGHVYTLLAYPGAVGGRRVGTRFDHYSLLRTTEDIFCLPHLAGAALSSTISMLPAIGGKRCAPL